MTNRTDDPRWREACLRVDKAASLLEATRKSVDPNVWDARDRWAEMSIGWLMGTASINDVIEAACGFESAAETAAATLTTPSPTQEK